MSHMPVTAQPEDEGGGSTDLTFDLVNNEATSVVAGTPVYIDSPGGFRKAKADDEATGRTIGVVQDDIAAGESGAVQFGGALELTTAEWDAVAGTTGGLAYGTPYYLSASTAGRLTVTPPSSSSEVVQQVLIAVSTTLAVVKIADPDVIGAGTNLVELENDNGSSMLIGQPVYSSSADGVDLGRANGSGKSTIIGLVADTSIASGARGDVAVGGLIVATTAQWDAIAGTAGGLTFNTTYYLDPTTAGRLTSTAPTTNGQEVVPVITALSTTEARIAIAPPILL